MVRFYFKNPADTYLYSSVWFHSNSRRLQTRYMSWCRSLQLAGIQRSRRRCTVTPRLWRCYRSRYHRWVPTVGTHSGRLQKHRYNYLLERLTTCKIFRCIILNCVLYFDEEILKGNLGSSIKVPYLSFASPSPCLFHMICIVLD